MAREKQQFLTDSQMKALSYKIKFPLSSNVTVSRHCGVSAEVVRQWFSPDGKSLPAQCYGRKLSTGKWFPEPTHKGDDERQLASIQSVACRDYIRRFEALQQRLGPIERGGKIDIVKAQKIFALIESGVDLDDLN